MKAKDIQHLRQSLHKPSGHSFKLFLQQVRSHSDFHYKTSVAPMVRDEQSENPYASPLSPVEPPVA